MLVFDIGGTWFRCGRIDENGELGPVLRRPASSFRSFPDRPVAHLQADIVDFICEQAAANPSADQRIAISFGGVIDQRTGRILNAAPLWGAGAHAFDLVSEARRRLTGHDVRVYNDVAAAAAAYAAAEPGVSRLGVLLVSTGCAFRAISGSLRPDFGVTHGLHGEIGHLRHDLIWEGQPMRELCDCGGVNHLNAFSSGRGIHALWQRAERAASGTSPRDFRACLDDGDPAARAVLRCAIRPVASTILQIFTLDVGLERIVLAGGVIDWLGGQYLGELMDQLDGAGLYEVTTRFPDFFAQRVVIGRLGDEACLLGAHDLAVAGAAAGTSRGGTPA